MHALHVLQRVNGGLQGLDGDVLGDRSLQDDAGDGRVDVEVDDGRVHLGDGDVRRILFLDDDNSTLGPMAAAIADKAFHDRGQFTAAGVEPAHSLDSNMVAFMQGRGFSLADTTPREADISRESLSDYHVVVGLNQNVMKTVGKVPFRTSALSWMELDLPADENQEAWEALYKTLALQIRELMELLRGEEAE